MEIHRKLTISVETQVYDGLHRLIGRGRISSFLNALARPHVIEQEMKDSYLEMALDGKREAEAREWTESLITDAYCESR